MLSKQPLFVAIDGQLLSSGLQEDAQSNRKLLWETAENVKFYAGKVVRAIPSSLITLPEADFIPRGVTQQQLSSGVRLLWMASEQKVYSWYGPSATLVHTWDTAGQVDQVSTAEATYIDMVPWGDWIVLNNMLDQAVIYKPGTGIVALTDGPATAVQYAKKLNFLMAFGSGARKTKVQWSDADDIETWTAAAENAAGGLYIDDFDTGIKAVSRLGQAMSCFNEDQMALVYPTGDSFYFGQRTVLDGVGAISKRAVISDGSNNYGVSRNGIWWADGSSSRYLDLGFLHDYLQENVNWDQGSKIHAARNDISKTLDFYFPMLEETTCSEGWSFDPQTGGWSKLAPCAIQEERKLFSKPIVGIDTTRSPYTKGQFRLMEDNAALAGPLSLKTKPLLMQLRDASGFVDCHSDSFINEVELFVKEASNVRFRLESQEKAGASWVASAWQTVQGQTQTYLIENMASGVYWRVVFESTTDNWSLNLQGFILFGRVEGSKRA